MTAFLVETTESRMLLLQALQSRQRLGYPVQIALVDGLQVKGINICLRRIRQRFGPSECFTVAPVSGELTDTAHLELARRNHASFIGSQQIVPSVGRLS